jgi:hypothetical protein
MSMCIQGTCSVPNVIVVTTKGTTKTRMKRRKSRRRNDAKDKYTEVEDSKRLEKDSKEKGKVENKIFNI